MITRDDYNIDRVYTVGQIFPFEIKQEKFNAVLYNTAFLK